MAASQNFMDTPTAKAVTTLATTLLAGLIIWACGTINDGIRTITTKMDSVQVAISNLGTNQALTQREVKALDESLRGTTAEVKQLKEDVLVLRMRADQYDKRGR